MSKHVRHDGSGSLQIRFGYDRRLVELVKTLPSRRWNASERYWSAPVEDVLHVVELLHGEGFTFDSAVCELYASCGGPHQLAATPERMRSPARNPGLFDGLDGDPAPEPDGRTAADLTVGALNEQVREVLESAFPSPVWLVGEIDGFNKSAHRKHVGFKLVERDDEGKPVSEVSATLFDRTKREIRQQLAAAGDPFRLEDELTVRMLVRVELYVPWGSYRVIVEQLDLSYTLGEAARRREEIVRRLTEQGLVGRNTALPFPALPLRVGLVTSLGSDAYNDVLRTLQESGFAFHVHAHGARVQGRATEPSVLNALDWFAEHHERFDVVLICRGGGSRTDLAWFDSEALGRRVAGFPLPVVVGIGHEQDQSVLDAVGWRCKTPTAAASLLVETVGGALEQLESRTRMILEGAMLRVTDERRRRADRAARLARATRNRLQQETERLGFQRQRTVRAAGGRIALERRELIHRAGSVPRAASVLAGRHRGILDGLAQRIGPAGRRLAGRELERLDGRTRRLGLVDPQRTIERGYAILRGDDGRVLTEPLAAPAGATVRARLRGGRLRLTSEGPDGDGEG